jgi:hypothetical protein
MHSGAFSAVAWSNGGTTFGLKISEQDRDQYLVRDWGTIYLELSGTDEAVEVNIDKASMWEGTCRELISRKIGDWLKRAGKRPWPKGKPPRVSMEYVGDRRFKVDLLS